MTTVLFADDNPLVCEYCGRELQEEGYDVLIAYNGEEALHLAASQLPDVVVLDICMPGVNGLEAAVRIRKTHPLVPIVFFTHWDDSCLEHESARYADACVEKSADLTELKHVIAAALRARRQHRRYQLGLPPQPTLGTACRN